MEVKKTEESKGINCLQVYLQTRLLNHFPGRVTILLDSLCSLKPVHCMPPDLRSFFCGLVQHL